MKIGIIDLVNESLHPAPNGHPENSGRVKQALEYIFNSDIQEYIEKINAEFKDLDSSSLFKIHDRQYIEKIKSVADTGGGAVDPDTYITSGSYEAAMSVVQATVGSIKMLFEGKYNNILIAGRPPGHHAEYGRGAGFCLINNSAFAAQNAIDNYNLEKTAIIDWDVHHGNGTQNIFYSRSNLLYISLHQYPFYPGTGGKSENGIGKGKGFTINIPIMAGAGDEEYLDIFYNRLIPALDDYKPKFIIITAGFDAHREDFLGGMELSSEVYEVFAGLLKEVAMKHCENKVLSFFEGGYNPRANSESLYYYIRGMTT